MSKYDENKEFRGHFKVIRGLINVIQMFCISARYLVARFHKVVVMQFKETGPVPTLPLSAQ